MARDRSPAPSGATPSPSGPADAAPVEDLASTLVRLTAGLDRTADVDEVLELLASACTEQLGLSGAAVLLQEDGGARVAAATGDLAGRFAELELRSGQGPATDCLHTGSVRGSDDLAKETKRWPLLREAARLTQLHTAFALPLTRGEETGGALLLLRAEPGGLLPEQRAAATAMLTVAGRVLDHRHQLQRALQVTEQLEQALTSRLVIEQAKGVLSERKKVPIEVVFTGLRRYSRERNLKLAELARAVVRGDVDVEVERRRRARDTGGAGLPRSRRRTD